MVVVGSSLAGRFSIERLVAHGSMTTVYQALDRETRQRCAIKVLSAPVGEFRHRFLREATVLSRLRHHAIVGYIGNGIDPDGLPYLAMDWLEGEDLDRRLARGRLALADALMIARRVAEALVFAHAAGIIHRDIKPGNIVLVDGDPARAMVVDFGLARYVMAQGLTRTGLTMGTPGYMAPEQARGAADLDERVDLYSLGCVLFHTISGVPPYAGEHVIAVLARLLLDEPPSLRELRPDVPADLDELVGRLMTKDPDGRPRSAAEVVAALDAVGQAPQPAQPIVFTDHERRLLSLILIAPSEPRVASATDVHAALPPRGPVVDVVASFGGSCEGLADGTILALLPGRGTAADAAIRAARCALALRPLVAGQVALGTGWAEVIGRRRVVAEVMDRAMSVLAEARIADDGTTTVRVDDVTAGLLETGFRIDRDDAGLILAAERDSVETAAQARGIFVGRDRELRQMLDLLRGWLSGHAGALLVSGPPGIGKSRLRVELVRRLASVHPDAQVWMAHGDPVRAGNPFSLAAQLVRRALGIADAETPEASYARLSSRIQRRLPAADAPRVTAALAEIIGAHSPAQARDRSGRQRPDPSQSGETRRAAWEDWLDAESRSSALLIVIEDLHWGDLSSVKLIDGALRRLVRAPLAVVATARPEVHEQFPGLWLDRGVHEIRLGPLAEAAARQLARGRLPGDVPDGALDNVLERAEGNPLFLEELCRTVRDRPVANDERGRWSAHALPPTLVAVVEARLEALVPAQRSVLRAASVFGHHFWRGGVAVLVGDPAAVDDALPTLIARDLVQPCSDGSPGEHAFRHTTVLEVAYASLTQADRQLGHRLAGQWLVDNGCDDPMVLAEHFDRGGERARAVEWYLRAAESSLDRDDLDAAVVRAERGAKCGAAGATLGRLLRVEAEAELWRARYVASEHAARGALRHLSPWSRDWVEASGVLALAAGHLDRTEDVADLAAELLEATPPVAVTGEAITVAARLATYVLLGGSPSAPPIARRLLDWLGGGDDLPAMARAWRDTAEGHLAFASGDVGALHAHMALAARHFDSAGDLHNAAYGQRNLGVAALEIGDAPRAEAVLRRGLALAVDRGIHAVATQIRPDLARALAPLGKLDEAAHIARIAITAASEQRDRRTEGAARLALADTHLRAGQLIAAQTEIELAVELADRAPARRAGALSALAEILLAAKEDRSALATVGEAMTLLERGGAGAHEAHIRLTSARALARAGKVAEARTVLVTGRRRLYERAGRIGDPELRAAYLHMQVNARLISWEP